MPSSTGSRGSGTFDTPILGFTADDLYEDISAVLLVRALKTEVLPLLLFTLLGLAVISADGIGYLGQIPDSFGRYDDGLRWRFRCIGQ